VADRLRSLLGPGESYSDVILRLAAVGHASRKPRPIFYFSLGEGAIVNRTWIDRPVDRQGCALCFHVSQRSMEAHHAQAVQKDSSWLLT
jgi:hypothetical protein